MGSDGNDGSIGSPFLTIGRALAAAAAFDYQHLYQPTIHLAHGNYTGVQVVLPVLTNTLKGNGGTIIGDTGSPASVTVADAGADNTFTASPFSTWTISGVSLTGTHGGIVVAPFARVVIASVEFAGSFSNNALFIGSFGLLEAIATTLTVTSSTMNSLMFIGGFGLFNNTTITFSNPVTFAAPWISMDSAYAFLAFQSTSVVNGSNVTASALALQMTNGAFFETPGALVDGVALTRSNFPGHTGSNVAIDWNCIFQPDNGYFNGSSGVFGFTSSASATGVPDTGLSRLSPGIMIVGNGTSGDFSGTLIANALECNSIEVGSGTLGFNDGSGAGGAVTQATSKSTGVILNKATGQITMNAAALAADTTVTFVMTNSTIDATDVIILNHVSGGTAGSYALNAQPTSGGASINVRNISSGSLSEAIVIGFVVIKGSVS